MKSFYFLLLTGFFVTLSVSSFGQWMKGSRSMFEGKYGVPLARFGTFIGIEEYESVYSVFPNPADDVVTLFGDVTNPELRMEIYSLSGQLVERVAPVQDIQGVHFSGKQIDVSDYASGAYVFIIRGNRSMSKVLFIVR